MDSTAPLSTYITEISCTDATSLTGTNVSPRSSFDEAEWAADEEFSKEEVPGWAKVNGSEQVAQKKIVESQKTKNPKLGLNNLKLVFRKGPLKRLPTQCWFQMTHLQLLVLSNHNLTALPKELKLLYNLKKICIDGNKFIVFPPVLQDMRRLQQLEMSRNPFKDITGISKVRRLLVLNAAGCGLKGPQIMLITQCQRLRRLDISSNKLTELPSMIACLTHLEKFEAANNKIKVFPKEIATISTLQHIDMSRNKLKEVPLEVGGLKKLKKLQIIGNPLTGPVKELQHFNERLILHYQTRLEQRDK